MNAIFNCVDEMEEEKFICIHIPCQRNYGETCNKTEDNFPKIHILAITKKKEKKRIKCVDLCQQACFRRFFFC